MKEKSDGSASSQPSQKKAKLDSAASPKQKAAKFVEDDSQYPKDALHKLLKQSGVKFGRNSAMALGA